MTSPAEQDRTVLHCDWCNSDVPEKQLLPRTWNRERLRSCPNCGTPIEALRSEAGPPETLPYVTPHELPGDELRICVNCGEAYHSSAFDPFTGEVRPVRFCPHCGNPVGQD